MCDQYSHFPSDVSIYSMLSRSPLRSSKCIEGGARLAVALPHPPSLSLSLSGPVSAPQSLSIAPLHCSLLVTQREQLRNLQRR